MKTEVSKLGLGLRIQNSRFKINLECVKLRSYNIKVESENLNVTLVLKSKNITEIANHE